MSSALPEPIDIHAFTQAGQVVSGELRSDRLERLTDLAVGEPTAIHWTFAGSSLLRADGSREAHAELTLSGSVRMACTRCLQPLACGLDEHRGLRFVGTESQAESEDAEDESFDVLVASRQFDLAGLIEDEILLALPPAPRHLQCQLPLAAGHEQARAGGQLERQTSATKPAVTQGLADALRAAQARREKDGAKD